MEVVSLYIYINTYTRTHRPLFTKRKKRKRLAMNDFVNDE